MKKIGKTGLWRAILSASTILLSASVGGIAVTKEWSGYINKFLNISSTKIVETGDGNEDPIHYKSDYNDYKSVRNHARDIAKQVQAEGTVLRTNKNNALPLNEKAKVTFFGYNQVDLALGGTGSGGVTSSEERKRDLVKACKDKIELNRTIYDFYKKNYDEKRGFIEKTGWGGKTLNFRVINQVNEINASEFDSDRKASYNDYSDAAIFVLTRIGGEGTDLKADYLSLTEEEKSVLEERKNGPFKKRIVLVNTFNAPELGFLDEYNIDSCLYIGGPGEVGLDAVTDILVGKTAPSGHLADTYAYDVEANPSRKNFGNFDYANKDAIINPDSRKYLVYQEGIYVGYRYFETRYEDYVLGRGNSDSKAGVVSSKGNWRYNEEVQFPFGYGLSYATFTQTLDDRQVDWNNKTAKATVTVKNNSTNYSAKDVVELYAQAPYGSGIIEKSAIQLVGFAKTGVIAPGQSAKVTIDVSLSDLASYDYTNSKTYVLEQGDYYFAIGNGTHEALNNILESKVDGVQKARMDAAGDASKARKFTKGSFAKDEYRLSGNNATITNQFDATDLNYYLGDTDQKVTYLSRKDWNGTYPTGVNNLSANNKRLEEIGSYYSEKTDGTTSPSAYEKGSSDTSSITTGAEKKYTLAMRIGADYDDENWDKLLDQITLEEYYSSTAQGRNKMESVGLNATTAVDGPSAWTKSQYIEDYKKQYDAENVKKTEELMVSYPTETIIAGTWNVPLTNEVGDSFGEEGLWGGGVGWYGPAANTHRTPCGGRNFEYYSEDGFLAGKLCEAETKGARNKGTIPYLKHFFLNDQETNRIGVCTFSNEQAIREVYLRAFQYAFETTGKEDKSCTAVMGAFNRLGLVWTGHHSNLWKNVREKEWGFKGAVTTDFGQKQGSLREPQLAYEAGTTMFCTSGTGFAKYLQGVDITKDYKLRSNRREAIHRQLYVFANSAARNGLTSSSKIVQVNTWYDNTLIAMTSVFSVLVAGSLGLLIYNRIAGKKEEN